MYEQEKKDWWSRNWKWFIPVACLTVIVIIVAFILFLMYAVFGFMKSSEVYQEAFARAKANQYVIETIGQPVEEGFFLSGNINVSGSSGNADLAIPISGPKGEGTVFVAASRSAGQWMISMLIVENKQTGTRINLLE